MRATTRSLSRLRNPVEANFRSRWPSHRVDGRGRRRGWLAPKIPGPRFVHRARETFFESVALADDRFVARTWSAHHQEVVLETRPHAFRELGAICGEPMVDAVFEDGVSTGIASVPNRVLVLAKLHRQVDFVLYRVEVGSGVVSPEHHSTGQHFFLLLGIAGGGFELGQGAVQFGGDPGDHASEFNPSIDTVEEHDLFGFEAAGEGLGGLEPSAAVPGKRDRILWDVRPLLLDLKLRQHVREVFRGDGCIDPGRGRCRLASGGVGARGRVTISSHRGLLAEAMPWPIAAATFRHGPFIAPENGEQQVFQPAAGPLAVPPFRSRHHSFAAVHGRGIGDADVPMLDVHPAPFEQRKGEHVVPGEAHGEGR